MTLPLAQFIEAASDRIIGDDLIAGPQTYVIESVKGSVMEGKKRLVIKLEGADRPFIPAKGMSRLLGFFWGGEDAERWAGKKLTLYRDPDVRFGADTTGGVRVCAVSDIDEAANVPIRTSKKTVRNYKIEPIKGEADPVLKYADTFISLVNDAPDTASLETFVAGRAAKLAELASKRPELHAECLAAIQTKRDAFAFDDDEAPPAYAGKVAEIMAAIASANTKSKLDDARADYDLHALSLPQEVADTIEAALKLARETQEAA